MKDGQNGEVGCKTENKEVKKVKTLRDGKRGGLERGGSEE